MSTAPPKSSGDGPAPAKDRSILSKLVTLDRRWLFLVMGLAVVVPFFAPIGLPATPSGSVVDAYDAVESLPDGATVFISMDFDPASRPELDPYAKSLFYHLKRKRAKIVIGTLWEYAPPIVMEYISDILLKPLNPAEPNDPVNRIYERKIDYIFLGFKAGKQTVISNLGTSIGAAFRTTYEGEPLESIPLLQGIKNLQSFSENGGLVLLVSAGFPGAKEYVEILSRYNLPMVTSTTAVSKTDLQPYYASGQLRGLVAGMQGSAEYELLVQPKGVVRLGAKGLDVLNIGSLVIMAAILLGNFIYFAERRRARRGAL